MTTEHGLAPPPERFNYAEHLLAANAGRARKIAFLDDVGALTYGELDMRVRQFAAALLGAGVRREERVLLLMLDSLDWPVAFLGTIYAGAVPVAVNTLLTPDDYAYMLEHSRAQAAVVSGALRPVLRAALTKSDHEARTVVVSRPNAPLDPSEVEFEGFLAGAEPLVRSAATAPTIPRSGSIPPVRPDARKGRCIRTPIPGGPANSTAKPCSA